MLNPEIFSQITEILSTNRSLCLKSKSPVREVLLPFPQRSVSRSSCFFPVLVEGSSVCLSFLLPHNQSLEEGSGGHGHSHTHCSSLAKESLVSAIAIQKVKGKFCHLPKTNNLLLQGSIVHPAVDLLHLTAWMLKGKS